MDEIEPRELIVEALGTFALCFMGIGAIISTQGQGGLGLVAVALAHGLAIGLMVLAAGHISGGHFNPAITSGMMAARRISIPKGVIYIVAQLIGAVLGAGAVTLVFADADRNANAVELGVPAVGHSILDPAVSLTNTNVLVMEAILTFFLVFVVFGTAVDKRSRGRWIAGLAIGLTITMGILAGGAVSGAAMNPARWFGPAVIQRDFTDGWLWVVGPVAGGLVAALLYNDVLMGSRSLPGLTVSATDNDPAVETETVEKAPPPKRRSSRRK